MGISTTTKYGLQQAPLPPKHCGQPMRYGTRTGAVRVASRIAISATAVQLHGAIALAGPSLGMRRMGIPKRPTPPKIVTAAALSAILLVDRGIRKRISPRMSARHTSSYCPASKAPAVYLG